jgi:molybdate transport system ATP-binding protein
MSTSKTLTLNINVQKQNFKLTVHCQIEWKKPGIHVVFGKSGCGKSHLLRAIAGLEDTQGYIEYEGCTWLNTPQKIHMPCHQRNASVVFQDSQLFSHLNVYGNLQFAFKRSSATQQDWQHVIQALHLEPLLTQRPSQLSGGEKQRVSLGRSLLSKPALLLMDEPLASLDWHSKQEIMPYIQRISKEWQLPILYVTHSIDEVMQLADQVIILNKKNDKSVIEKMGPLVELLQDVQQGFNQAAKAGSIIYGTLLENKNTGTSSDTYTESSGLSRVLINEEILYTPIQTGLTTGPIRLCIQASDVSLALSASTDSSIINILPANVHNIARQDNGQCLISLILDGQTLLSRISNHSVDKLNLKVGQCVFAQIKAVALQQSMDI